MQSSFSFFVLTMQTNGKFVQNKKVKQKDKSDTFKEINHYKNAMMENLSSLGIALLCNQNLNRSCLGVY